MNLVISLFQEIRISHVLTVSISSEEYRHIAHPVAYIIFFSLLFYGLGINSAKREKNIARRKLSPRHKRLLFFNQESRFTLNTILSQIYLITVTVSCLLSILFVPDINPNQIVSYYGRLTSPLFLIHILFLVRADLKKKRKK